MTLLVALLAALLSGSAQHPTMPAGMSHEEHVKQMEKDAALNKRGAATMGFDQNTTVHHFRLSPTGGSIDVDVRRPGDIATRAQIRVHLKQIAGDFAKGNFSKPTAIHAEVPHGVTELRKHRDATRYRYEETPRGARVVITANEPSALEAVHAFLRYQIMEHKTGDPMRPRQSRSGLEDFNVVVTIEHFLEEYRSRAGDFPRTGSSGHQPSAITFARSRAPGLARQNPAGALQR